MKELVLVTLAVVTAMAILAAAVVIGRDTTTFVSPPEVVAEDFVRHLAAGRYDRAAERLADPAGAVPMLAARGKALRAHAGAVNVVEGEHGAITGESATAAVRIDTAQAGPLRCTFALKRQHGAWKIVSFREEWRARQDSNLWPSAPEADALSS